MNTIYSFKIFFGKMQQLTLDPSRKFVITPGKRYLYKIKKLISKSL